MLVGTLERVSEWIPFALLQTILPILLHSLATISVVTVYTLMAAEEHFHDQVLVAGRVAPPLAPVTARRTKMGGVIFRDVHRRMTARV